MHDHASLRCRWCHRDVPQRLESGVRSWLADYSTQHDLLPFSVLFRHPLSTLALADLVQHAIRNFNDLELCKHRTCGMTEFLDDAPDLRMGPTVVDPAFEIPDILELPKHIEPECLVLGARKILIVIQNDADYAEAKALIERLMDSNDPADQARMAAQARLIEAYERSRWPRRAATVPELLTYLMDQHGLTRSDLVPLLGTASRVSEVLNGKRELSMSMIRKIRGRFRVSADLLIPHTHSHGIAA